MREDYILGNLDREIERLEIQASLFEPITRQAILNAGLRKGMRCIDIGCGSGSVTRLMAKMVGKTGSVTGVDMDKKYLEYCRRINVYNNVDFVHDNIIESKLGLEASFDIVYSRFMFQHLKDRKEAVRSMKRLAKVGGIVIIQELDHAPHSWLCYPENENVNILWEVYVTLVKKVGGDPMAGRKLYKLLVDESLDASVECYSPVLLMGHEPYSSLGWRIAESLKPQIMQYDLLTKKQYDKMLNGLKAVSRDKNSFVTYARFFSAVGLKMMSAS